MKPASKLFAVRVPEAELEAFERVLARWPGASPAVVIRALVLASTPVQVATALTEHFSRKGGR